MKDMINTVVTTESGAQWRINEHGNVWRKTHGKKLFYMGLLNDVTQCVIGKPMMLTVIVRENGIIKLEKWTTSPVSFIASYDGIVQEAS